MLLAMQLVQLFQFLSNSNDYYPISLGVLGLNLIAYFQPGQNWPSVQQACISVRGAWFDKEWKRIFLASFYHTHDFHLYYNMASFIWKAISLEQHFGSGYFLYMVAIFSVTTNLVYMAINYALAEILDQWSYINSCAVGFSGVLFALKVVTTHIQPAGMTRVMGFIPVPMRIACWVELVVISVLFPNVSFVGHLAGIVVGFAFVYGPLRVIMDMPLSLFTDLIPSGTGTGQPHQQQYSTDGRSYTYRTGTTGHRTGSGQAESARPHPPSRQAADDTREYHSYTYAAGVSGRGEASEMTEEAELQEAIRRSLSGQGEMGEERGQGAGERRGEDDSTSEDVQATIERSILHREGRGSPSNTVATDSTRPPPYNPHFPTESESSDATTAEPHSNVGWNRDLLEPSNDTPDSEPRPLGFDAVQSDPDSIPTQLSGNTGTDLRHRRTQTQDTHHTGTDTPPPPATQGRGNAEEGGTASLTRQEMREARLLRFGGSGVRERERRPLSELASHSFNFKK
jgi:rhomboid domain-containing protein 1